MIKSKGKTLKQIDSLYPLKFKPILKSIIWGGDAITDFKNIKPARDGIGESWEISSVKNNTSIVSNGDLRGVSLEEIISIKKELIVGKKIHQEFGDTFPLLTKFIDANNDLSIQVHPDDKMAQKHHNSFGKTEMWYVVNAAPGAFIYSGFEESMSPNKFVDSINDGTFTDKLKKHIVKEGDVFFLPAGRVHAIGAGCFIAEIQQTSDITYRIYDYERRDANGNLRELHTDLAKEAIDYNVYDSYKIEYHKKDNLPVKLVSCPYFTTNLIELDIQLNRNIEKLDSFIIYMCLKGHCTLKDDKGNSIFIDRGESVLMPADTNSLLITPSESSKLLEIYID